MLHLNGNTPILFWLTYSAPNLVSLFICFPPWICADRVADNQAGKANYCDIDLENQHKIARGRHFNDKVNKAEK